MGKKKTKVTVRDLIELLAKQNWDNEVVVLDDIYQNIPKTSRFQDGEEIVSISTSGKKTYILYKAELS